MSELPASVRTALWLTAQWHGHCGPMEPSQLWRRALPDIDAVGGDGDRVELWRELGERAVLVCLTDSAGPRFLPPTTPEALADVLSAGECLMAPTLGGLLVPVITLFGPEGGTELDRGHRLDWLHHESQGLRTHRVEALDHRDARRRLQEAIVTATTRLEGLGANPFIGREATPPTPGSSALGLPPGIPDVCRAGIATAALVTKATDRGLAEGSDALTAAAASEREMILRELGRQTEAVLEDFTNLAVAVLAGWRPAP